MINAFSHWVVYVATVLVTVAVTVAAMVAISYWSTVPAPAYVEYKNPLADVGAVCASSRVTQTIPLTVKQPAILSAVVSILDDKESIVVPNVLVFTVAVPVAKEILDTVPWVVPNLPPSQYQRVVGVTTYGRSSQPAFMVTKFRIIPCP